MYATISPEEAWQAMSARTAVFLDVRTTSEFAGGHPQGAYHVPLMDADPQTHVAGYNEGFVEQVRTLQQHLAASAEGAPPLLVIGCQVGGRSRQACQLLSAEGIEGLADCAAGWIGQRNGMGQLSRPGWLALGLPAATDAEAGRSWPDVRALVGTQSAP